MSIFTITDDNYEAEVAQSDKTVLLDFWADWCGPCKMLSPVVDEIAEEKGEALVVGKINVDDEPELSRQFNVMSIPTLVVIKEGQIVNTLIGVRPKEEILKVLE